MPRKATFSSPERYHACKSGQAKRYRDRNRRDRSDARALWLWWEEDLLIDWKRTDRELMLLLDRSITAVQRHRSVLKSSNKAPTQLIEVELATGEAQACNAHALSQGYSKLIPAHIDFDTGLSMRIIPRDAFARDYDPSPCVRRCALYTVEHDFAGIDGKAIEDIDRDISMARSIISICGTEGYPIEFLGSTGRLTSAVTTFDGIVAYKVIWDVDDRAKASALYVATADNRI